MVLVSSRVEPMRNLSVCKPEVEEGRRSSYTTQKCKKCDWSVKQNLAKKIVYIRIMTNLILAFGKKMY